MRPKTAVKNTPAPVGDLTTPGGWYDANEPGFLRKQIVEDGSYQIATMDVRIGDREAFRLADQRANLFCAAPKLLKVAKAIKERAMGNIYNTDQETGETFAALLDAAIAEAEVL